MRKSYMSAHVLYLQSLIDELLIYRSALEIWKMNEFLRALTKQFRKETISFFVSVLSSIRPSVLPPVRMGK
jgi:hypothetical protein